jgi:hypothetical protein
MPKIDTKLWDINRQGIIGNDYASHYGKERMLNVNNYRVAIWLANPFFTYV